MNRRELIAKVSAAVAGTAVAASAKQESEPQVDVIYLVKAELKCTEEQARVVEQVLAGLGKQFNEWEYQDDWKISKTLYGAWER